MKPSSLLIIFVKSPTPGTVKTRLAMSIGHAAAATAYRSLVEELLSRLAGVASVQLHYSPPHKQTQIVPWLRHGWDCYPQSAGDLGERLRVAFEKSHAAGFQKTIVIGSDCPYVQPADIQAAEQELDIHDLVLGPAQDGGYWLIGLREPQARLFQDIAWSTDQVRSQTLERADQIGLKWSQLRVLSDIDSLEDWERYQSSKHPVRGN
jgi:rSAM/selenodomain-associated transferase 1